MLFGKSKTAEPPPPEITPADDDKPATSDSDADTTNNPAHDDAKKPDGDKEEKEEKEEPPKKTSWWSLLTSPSTLSFLSTTLDDAMAANPPGPPSKDALMKTMKAHGGKLPDQGQTMKAAADKIPDTPEKEQLLQALAAHQNANGLLQKALQYKDTAMKAMDPAERQRMMQEAYDKEVEANGQSKWARRLQSGTWQGGMGGAGIGTGVGAGLGTVVGAVVGGVAAIPTTAVGGLVGLGVGGITGPFVKLNQDKAKAVAEREKAKGKSEGEIVEAVKAEAGEEVESEAGDGGDGGAGEGAAFSQVEHGSAKRDLERQVGGAGKTGGASRGPPPPTRDPNLPRKKPKKLEVRSSAKSAGAGAAKGKENKA
ncbi:hypothetical protein LTR53_007985 [Teratosphaeriaceae sp. CCFEE 6253]|nr:hypothetical protein LTR53_007985 [Teratosphaeriaceae sp. CCFEE 6253]